MVVKKKSERRREDEREIKRTCVPSRREGVSSRTCLLTIIFVSGFAPPCFSSP